MPDSLDLVYRSIEQHADGHSSSRRAFVRGAAATVGGAALLGTFPTFARASATNPNNDVQKILNVAATAEVLATIVNTVGARKRVVGNDPVTQLNIEAAAREELIHYDVLVKFGATPVTKKIWVPDAVFANRTNFLETLVAGDQIFVNAYLIGVSCFAAAGSADLAAVPAEFMGTEAVHRALALQSLGRLGNDRVFMSVDFTDIGVAVTRLQEAGFGFGEAGSQPGKFYEFDKVSKHTPDPAGLNTLEPTPIAC